MSDTGGARHTVTNHQNQPVGLHVAGCLVVGPPLGQADLSEADRDAPQLKALVAGRIITISEAATAAAAEGPAGPEYPSGTSDTGGRGRAGEG
jgi:hypothetical protein